MSNETFQLQPTEPGALAVPVKQQDPVAAMLQAVVDKGVTGENVASLKELVGLYERMQDRNAEKEFAAAFVALQADLPSVKMTKPVPDKHGNLKYKFAPYEDIMAQVRPLALCHGFTITFSCDFNEGRIIQTCILQHTGGHKRSNSFGARIGSGPPGASEAQADGAASTYAKRFALCNALNIICEVDTDGAPRDARNEGETISADKVQYLVEQVRETNSDAKKFLALAGVERFEDIRTGSYDVLVRALAAKRGRA